jgi:hypothetical protein
MASKDFAVGSQHALITGLVLQEQGGAVGPGRLLGGVEAFEQCE